jgi:hypothetical protein
LDFASVRGIGSDAFLPAIYWEFWLCFFLSVREFGGCCPRLRHHCWICCKFTHSTVLIISVFLKLIYMQRPFSVSCEMTACLASFCLNLWTSLFT